MITKHFKKLIGTLFQADGSGISGNVPIVDTSGATKYLGGVFDGWPGTVVSNYVTSATDAGIVLGTGNAAATENDYKIQTPITSGLNVTVTFQRGVDSDGNPYGRYILNVTNTSGSEIAIREIAFNQAVTVAASNGSNTPSSAVVCLDHTVFATPAVIPAGNLGTINYILKATLS